jgi:ribosomal-protein-serine acetyltransferase
VDPQVPEITLRPPDAADAPAVAEAVLESVADINPWMGWATPSYDESSARTWIEDQAAERSAGTAFEFLILDAAGRVIGACGINQINRIHRYANLGYWVRTSAAGKGFAVAAVAALSDWVFAGTDIERLEIVVGVGNRRSERVAEKAGARREGVLRSRLLVNGAFQDATMFGIVRPGG